MRLLFAVFLTLSSFAALAADAPQTHALMTDEEQEIRERAKKRLYPGGRDEDSLKVQSQLAQPSRKMGPATEITEEAPPADQLTD